MSGHVTTHSRKLPFKSANSPFAERQRIADRKRLLPNPLRRFFLAEWYFITKLGPQVSPFPIQLRDKSDFILELTINAQRLRAKSVQHPFLLLAICWSLRSDPNPWSSISKLKSSMADQNQAVQVNLIPFRSIR
jgi:hypothetical protein